MEQYSEVFERAFELVVMEYEGGKFNRGYVNDPDDPGGETVWGLTAETLRSVSYGGKIFDVTMEEAKEIYYEHFWKVHNIYLIQNEKIAIELFDQAVHFPWRVGNKHLQRAYNLVEWDKISLVVDGIVGDQTLQAINECSHQEDLYDSLNGLQHMRYIEECEKKHGKQKYYRGFLKRTRCHMVSKDDHEEEI